MKMNFEEIAADAKSEIEAEQTRLTAKSLLIDYKFECVKAILATYEEARKAAAEHGFSADEYEKEIAAVVNAAIGYTAGDALAVLPKTEKPKRSRKPKAVAADTQSNAELHNENE